MSKRIIQPSDILDFLDDGGAKKLADSKEAVEIVGADDYWLLAEEYAKSYGTFQGLSSGYKGVDDLTGSFLPGEVFVVAGSTGTGKSLFAQNIAFNLTKKDNMVLLITLEMTKEQTLSRMIRMGENEGLRSNLLFQKASAVTDRDVGILMKKASDDLVSLVILDHLHFLPRATDSVRLEISRITKHFKECAIEYKLPVMILSHISRGVEKDEKPDLKHLKESSSIEQDSDMVAFVHRKKETPNVMEFYMRKNRSRQLKFESIDFVQEGWRLTEIGEYDGS